MSAYLNTRKRAVVLCSAMIFALSNSALDALVRVTLAICHVLIPPSFLKPFRHTLIMRRQRLYMHKNFYCLK